ncbi:hypothetical protein SAMN06265795_117100 [Noviherbaspirillum humi]|uniref:Uncharacterized protein n=1 Tax=Noviherbaspirillum humi TaxID=1688639 RepID=A0A239KU08_9BURK|nr:hypothetical protein [Noviherbaspirillum humi]SNT21846.1 hypothetical protein SAMN06265795_117100 [Noviherbaspirillum humi]
MLKTGTLVGAGRWPNRKAHPDEWERPVSGQVLEFCDVRAWANTIHFPVDDPHPGDVMGMALKLKEQGLLEGLTPVCWDFGSHKQVLWEKTANLRPYAEDIQLWQACKALRMDEIAHPRRRKPRELGEFLPREMQHLGMQKLLPLRPML